MSEVAAPRNDGASRVPQRTIARDLLKDLLLHDPEIQSLLAAVIVSNIPAPPGPPVEPDASLGQWVQTLIETKLRQYVRPDALRRPL